ncbi:GyrI-like domain-containing protein [Salinimicrobium oceani]|uniref:AraC family transcriptional regulator n=1 Tax=Salinimicrobium oceani TaxID=2722702 RepID=A0ABX1D578_9FLAO|nr:GyrI-like domain-containing protein [Salinimicrobium oceani]NJW53711.1 AraC family transcriptional regulator [Salinimicrobium oceani]
MKIIKYLLFLFLIIFIAGSIYVATKDGEFTTESSRLVNAPAPMLFREVADLSNWKSWEAWSEKEGMIMDVSGNSSGQDASLTWQAENIRDGRIQNISVIPFSQIEQNLVMQTIIGEAEGRIHWTFTPEGDQTRVSWKLEGEQSFKDKLAFTVQDHDLAEVFQPIFEQSLENLEQNVIQKMEAYSINVDGVTQHGGGYYMFTTTASRMGEVSAKAASMIEQVRIFMQQNNISISGQPLIIYNQRDDSNGTTIFSTGVPTPSQVITPSGSEILSAYLEPQKVVKTTLKGHHKNSAEAWERTYRYIEDNNLMVNPQGQPFEIFITDPTQVENPALWVTEIYIPVE